MNHLQKTYHQHPQVYHHQSEGLPPPPPIGESAEENANVAEDESVRRLPPAPPSLSPSSEGLPPPPPIGESAEENVNVPEDHLQKTYHQHPQVYHQQVKAYHPHHR